MGDRTPSPDGDLHSEGDVLIQQNTQNENSFAFSQIISQTVRHCFIFEAWGDSL
jgi:hypothetical protein